MNLTEGNKAPDAALVTLGSEGLKTVRIAELAGKPALLLFFPLVNTGVCREELCSIRDGMTRYNNLGVRVVAISVDSPFAFKLWAEQEGFTFEFWSDFNKEAISAFGCQHGDLLGLRGVAKRSAFILDAAGTVRYAWVSDDPKQLPDFAAIVAALATIKPT